MNSGMPSSEAISEAIDKLMSNPEILTNIMGALGGSAPKQEKEAVSDLEEEVPHTAQASTSAAADASPMFSPELLAKLPGIMSALGGSGTASASSSKSRALSESEALLCALKPYLSPHRAEAVDKILKLSRLGSIIGNIK